MTIIVCHMTNCIGCHNPVVTTSVLTYCKDCLEDRQPFEWTTYRHPRPRWQIWPPVVLVAALYWYGMGHLLGMHPVTSSVGLLITCVWVYRVERAERRRCAELLIGLKRERTKSFGKRIAGLGEDIK